ncbi:MAG TPA: pilus assembly protein PilP [Aeromonadales bacterium]|nr:pilus assembly protein PilP [Aeromonadales bacterium]
MAFDLKDLNELDFENVGSWPAFVKYIAYLLVFALVVGLFYYLDTGGQQDRLASAQREETKLKKVFEKKYRKSANLEAYKIQMSEMEESFKHLLQQLPKGTEIPGLIDDISFSESASGLDIRATTLMDEKKVDFYSEKPFRLDVFGKYHSLGGFISRVASLPRIVTLHDFTIDLVDKKKAGGRIGDDPLLIMRITAKTYRYDQSEDQ